MDRRIFLISAGAAALVKAPSYAAAQTMNEIEIEGELPPLPQDLQEFGSYPPAAYLDISPTGSAKPKPAEVEEAYDILISSPFGKGHLAVFDYLLNLPVGRAMYRREWPIRANPVIYHFFSATGTKPEGDVTPWCAASMNWALLRGKASEKEQIGVSPGLFSKSGKPFNLSEMSKFTTGSAASGSFRCWPRTNRPQEGDILVLANNGTSALSQYCRGQGHVTIYLKHIDESHVLTIGGNQSLAGSNGAVTRAKFYIGAGSRFFGFVKAPA